MKLLWGKDNTERNYLCNKFEGDIIEVKCKQCGNVFSTTKYKVKHGKGIFNETIKEINIA